MPYGEIPAQKTLPLKYFSAHSKIENRKDTNREQNSLANHREMGSSRFRHRPCMVSGSVPQSAWQNTHRVPDYRLNSRYNHHRASQRDNLTRIHFHPVNRTDDFPVSLDVYKNLFGVTQGVKKR